MSKKNSRSPEVTEIVKDYYAQGGEAERLSQGQWQLEKIRTNHILSRFLPKSPATIVDVGGGAGAYALPLARQGYQVYLIDLVPLHIEQAQKAATQQKDFPLKACMVGDARKVDLPNTIADAVLLLGPLYHLPEKQDRLKAIAEAYRILKPGGLLFAVGISRYASFLNGLMYGFLDDPAFVAIVKNDIATGHHQNPTGKLEYFTEAYYHQPDELKSELATSGFKDISLLAIEGPGWLIPQFSAQGENKALQKTIFSLLDTVENDPNILGASIHIMAIGKK